MKAPFAFQSWEFFIFFFLPSFRMAYLHEISNWRFFPKPGKRQQPVTPTRHSIFSERPCSQSREANKNNNKGKKKKAESAEIRFYFPSCSPGVFQACKAASGQAEKRGGQVSGTLRRVHAGGEERRESGRAGLELGAPSRRSSGCAVPAPTSPSPGLGRDAYLQNPVSSPKRPRGSSILPQSSRPRSLSGTSGRQPPAKTGFGL